MRFNIFIIFTAALGIAGCGSTDVSPTPAVNLTGGDLAIQGYDPVAYFTVGEPTPGDPAITTVHDGATYRFSSEDHRRQFIQNPERYQPAYGGYCAYAIALNQIAGIDPNQWAIVDDTLYLNANPVAQGLWDFDRRGNIQAGDRYWAAYPKIEP